MHTVIQPRFRATPASAVLMLVARVR